MTPRTVRLTLSSVNWSAAPFALILLVVFLTSIGWLSSAAHTTNLNQSFAAPTMTHWLGTDFLGHDIFARGLHALRLSLLLGGLAAICSSLLGTILGIYAGWGEDLSDRVLSWVQNTFDSIPSILILSLICWSLGQGPISLFIALVACGWTTCFRLVRAETIKQKKSSYVLAAKALGLNTTELMKNHIFPNTLHLLRAQVLIQAIFNIKYEVILSFVGLGIEPGTPSIGVMLYDAKDEIMRGVWWGLGWATCLMLGLVLSLSLLIQNKKRY